MAIFFLPWIIPLLALWFYVMDKLLPLRSENPKVDAVANLDSAKRSVLDALRYLDEIEEQVQQKEKQHSILNELVKSLETASQDTADQLRRKLEAIRYIEKKAEYARLVLTFFLGVFSSLFASVLWSLAR